MNNSFMSYEKKEVNQSMSESILEEINDCG